MKYNRVLVLFPMNGQIGNALVTAFMNNGVECVGIDVYRDLNKIYSVVEKFNGEIDFVICSRTLELFGVIQFLKIKFPKIKSIVWNVDVRERLEEWGDLIPLFASCDYFFTVAKGAIDRYKKINTNSFWMPQAINDEKYYPYKGKNFNVIKGSDVCFIGNVLPRFHKERPALIAELLFDNSIDFVWYNNVFNETHNYVVSKSKINLSCSMCPEIPMYFSARLWKIIAAKGFVLEREHEGIKDFFNGMIETYSNVNDCKNKIKHILNNYPEYKKKALELHEWGMKYHTYTERVKKIMEIVS